MGAVIAVRLADQIREVMQPGEIHFWTDSQICLYSSFRHIKRVITWCHRFIFNARPSNATNRINGPLTASELDRAVTTMIVLAQSEVYGSETSQLRAGKPIQSGSSLHSLNAIVDQDGVMRLQTRLTHSHDSCTAVQPILLPPKHALTKLILHFSHLQVLHCGLTATLANFRENYWTPSARRTLRERERIGFTGVSGNCGHTHQDSEVDFESLCRLQAHTRPFDERESRTTAVRPHNAM
uniref:Integrase zinc-binding domain-containing protein n=1 Tax=Strigamia maritima TaxID=126957 RepID=T1J6R8_STRMM